MNTTEFVRLDVLKTAGHSALTPALARPGESALATKPVPFSSGTGAPKIAAPPGACDSHMHIFSTRFPASPHWRGEPVVDSDVGAYRLLQKRIGTTRTVVVTPSTYGTDNRATMDGVARLGRDARAVVVLDLDVTDAELKRLADGGAVGIRVNFVTPQSWGVTSAERLEEMVRKIAALGWHVQMYATGDQIVGLADVLSRLPTPLVIDHLARLPPVQGIRHPAYATVRRLLDGGRTWMKLSGAYLNTASGAPAYADASDVAKAFAQAAPDRTVWGSDWPHRGQDRMPDDANLLDLLGAWAPGEEARRKILIDNPKQLYRFTDA